MTVYPGVVRDGVVVLPDGVHLDDGQVVEVHVDPPRVDARVAPSKAKAPQSESLSEEEREDLFEQEMEAEGLIFQPTPAPPGVRERERGLIDVQGKPLSEMIIEERR